jgi:hypothetical protein
VAGLELPNVSKERTAFTSKASGGLLTLGDEVTFSFEMSGNTNPDRQKAASHFQTICMLRNFAVESSNLTNIMIN